MNSANFAVNVDFDFTNSNLYWQNVLLAMRQYFPYVFEHMNDWHQCGYSQVLVTLDDGRRFVYDDTDNTIQCVDDQLNGFNAMSKEHFTYNFHNKLYKALLHAGINQTELSEKTGISTVAISNYICGRSLPNMYTVYLIAKALGCSVKSLFPIEEAEVG